MQNQPELISQNASDIESVENPTKSCAILRYGKGPKSESAKCEIWKQEIRHLKAGTVKSAEIKPSEIRRPGTCQNPKPRESLCNFQKWKRSKSESRKYDTWKQEIRNQQRLILQKLSPHRKCRNPKPLTRKGKFVARNSRHALMVERCPTLSVGHY